MTPVRDEAELWPDGRESGAERAMWWMTRERTEEP